MEQLTQMNHLRMISMAITLGATLHKIDNGWMFEMRAHRRDAPELKTFQDYFYTPMCPVVKRKKYPFVGDSFGYVQYCAQWEFQIEAELEPTLREKFKYKDLPISAG